MHIFLTEVINSKKALECIFTVPYPSFVFRFGIVFTLWKAILKPAAGFPAFPPRQPHKALTLPTILSVPTKLCSSETKHPKTTFFLSKEAQILQHQK